MGAGQSARRLTVDNKEEIDVIELSNSVVQRLTQKVNESNVQSGNEVRSFTPPPFVNKTQPSPPPQSADAPSGYPVYYYPQLTLTALEIEQQKEQELLSQAQYWQKRLENLEKNHLKINQILQEEYKKAMEELYVSQDKKKLNIQNSVQPCLECSAKVLKCYQEHSKETLKCSNLVEQFSNCVDQGRARVIAERC